MLYASFIDVITSFPNVYVLAMADIFQHQFVCKTLANVRLNSNKLCLTQNYPTLFHATP